MQNTSKFKEIIVWLAWDFSGIRFIFRKILPETQNKNKRPPSSSMVWFLGIYFATFGIASGIYENVLARQYHKEAMIMSQLANPQLKTYALGEVCKFQQDLMPPKPKLWLPFTPFRTVFTRVSIKKEKKEWCKSIIVKHKDCLDSVYLKGMDLSNTNLSNARIITSNLEAVNFCNSDLIGASIMHSSLINAEFQGADLSFAELHNSDLTKAKLVGATGIDTDQLSKVYSLYKSDIKKSFKTELEQKGYAYLFYEKNR